MTRTRGLRRWWRLRPYAAYSFVTLSVMTVLFNLVSDRLVSRYEHDAQRDPDSIYLKGMSPRDLGPENAPMAVLFVHGFIGGQSNFNDLPDQVAALGWRVRTMRLPGHGTSPRDFERTSADALLAGVLDELRALKSDHARVVLVGHSMGGALATLAAAEEPVDGLVLCAPFFGLSLNRVLGISTERIIRSAATVLRWVPGRPGDGPINLEANKPYVDCYSWIPVQGALAALELKQRAHAPGLCAGITAPLLLIHSRLDTVTSPDASAAIFPEFGSTRKEIIWLEKSDHVLFWDYEEDVVAEALLRYLKEVEAHDHD